MPLEKARVFQNVVMKLSVLRFMVKAMSKQGKTDLNRQCETFFSIVLNRVYGYELKNANNDSMNEAAIDLADKSRGICFQVTSTSDAKKIKKTIAMFNKRKLYKDYQELCFLMLVGKKGYTTTFETDGHFTFDYKSHIIDIDDILAKAESLELSKLKALSDFVDEELPSVSRALAPESLLAAAERSDGSPPVTAASFLEEIGGEKGHPSWKRDFESLNELQRCLMSLSRRQREVILYMIQHAKPNQFGQRLLMSIQTLQQRLHINTDEMRSYYMALEKANLVSLDDEHHATEFELAYILRGSRNNAFVMFKEFLKDEKHLEHVILDCDFSLLD